MDSVFRLLHVVYDGFLEFGMLKPFHALDVEDAIYLLP